MADLTARVALLSPKPGDTVLMFVPEDLAAHEDGHGSGAIAIAAAALNLALKNADLPLGDIRGFILPLGFDVKSLDHAAIATSLGLLPLTSVVARLRARAAELTYTGDGEMAGVLRYEADRFERGEGSSG